MKIDYEQLQIAMSSNDPMGLGQHYLDTETGDVLLVSDWVEGESRKFDDPAAIEDETLRLTWYHLWCDSEVGIELSEAEERSMTRQSDACLKRFLVVPQADSHEAYQDMADFADTIASSHLRKLLQVALNGRSPFRRFKDVLYNHQAEREQWFAFSAQRWRERTDDWLEMEGMLSDD
ncbi:MAG: hypothetical protein H6658_09865 [Ardenticatenaceae bacterium]|nr:hypothetical protein [Ardenticatenaceae bacterium]